MAAPRRCGRCAGRRRSPARSTPRSSAVVVDTPEAERQPFDRRRDIQEALDDAVDLGAEVVRVEAPDVVTGLEQVARSHRATHLVLPHREVGGLQRLRERPWSIACSSACPSWRCTSSEPASRGPRPQRPAVPGRPRQPEREGLESCAARRRSRPSRIRSRPNWNSKSSSQAPRTPSWRAAIASSATRG